MFLTRDKACELCKQWQNENLVVGYSSGVFDMLHLGHVRYLETAREKCDRLILGVNSDASVRELKGSLRPIVSEDARAKLVAALHCVDAAFIFPEKNNNHNIRLLQPNTYFKAGDYTKEQLSSTPIVEEYGGEVCIVPFECGYSTSSQIEEILARYGAQLAKPVTTDGENAKKHNDATPTQGRPAVFLDRDGTLIEYVEHLHEPEKVKLLPGVADGLKKLQQAGFVLVITTNQPGIGLGYFSKEDFFRVNSRMLTLLGKQGVVIDKIYYSPLSHPGTVPGRKPDAAMAERAKEELGISLQGSFVIGDSALDMGFASNCGIPGVFVQTGKSALEQVSADYSAVDFTEASAWILQQEQTKK